MKASLPQPDADQRAHSERLAASLRAEIRSNGPMPFARWMERCLYAPGLGYYSAGARKFGAGGDFVTAPELGPLFAQCVVTSLLPALQALDEPSCFLELGAGSGAFAQAALMELAAQSALPGEYAILEPSADLRERQRSRLHEQLPAGIFARLRWLDAPPQQSWQGVLFANEVIDALPATRFAIRAGGVFEECVALDGEHFVSIDQAADDLLAQRVRELQAQIGRPFADGYRSELLPQLDAWMQSIAGSLARGVLMFVDYGHARDDYYAAERSGGTVQCYYQHRVHDDALALPGLQDITASVDFSAVANASAALRMNVHGYANQAQFLLGNGLVELHQRAAADADAAALYALAQQIKRLTLPEQMGERFKVLLLSRDMDAALLPDFSGIDRSARL